MCDKAENSPGRQQGQTKGQGYAPDCEAKIAEPTMRDRLEQRRARLARQLAEVDLALQLIYTNPDAEKIHEILHRARA